MPVPVVPRLVIVRFAGGQHVLYPQTRRMPAHLGDFRPVPRQWWRPWRKRYSLVCKCGDLSLTVGSLLEARAQWVVHVRGGRP